MTPDPNSKTLPGRIPGKARGYAAQALSVLFYAIVILLLFATYSPVGLKAHPGLVRSLAAMDDLAYVTPGKALESFLPYLPASGPVAFLTDHPFGKVMDEEKIFYDAQNFLVPRLLDTEGRSEAAVIFCSTPEIAAARMRQHHYAWVIQSGERQGVAKKISA